MSTPFQLILPRPLYERMVEQARAELPNECCGILAGRMSPGPDSAPVPRGLIVRCYPLVNAAGSPVEFLSEPRSMFDAFRDMRRLGIDLLAIYHSHPTSEPIPSRTDLERNYSPDVVNFILSLKKATPEMRGWWLSANSFREADWRLTEEVFG